MKDFEQFVNVFESQEFHDDYIKKFRAIAKEDENKPLDNEARKVLELRANQQFTISALRAYHEWLHQA